MRRSSGTDRDPRRHHIPSHRCVLAAHIVPDGRQPLLGRMPRLRQAFRARGTPDQPARIGPRRDELGTFATLISRLVYHPLGYEEALRALGEGPMVDLVHELEGGAAERLAAMDVTEGLGYLWPRLQELTKVLPTQPADTVPPRHRQPSTATAAGCSARIFICRGHARDYALMPQIGQRALVQILQVGPVSAGGRIGCHRP
jgi:hypothetical protein